MRVRLYESKRNKLNQGSMKTTFKVQQKVKLTGIPGESGGDVSYRLLEDGFIRLLEDNDFRILE